MPRNDDGEFELILGNKQLLSVFFIVVVMLGVFFCAGYFVGRNSTPVGASETARRGVQDAKPIVLDSSSSSQTAPLSEPPKPSVTTPAASDTASRGAEPERPAAALKTREEKPSHDELAAQAEKSARKKPAAEEAAAPPKPEPAPKPPPKKVEASAAAPRVTEPSSGLYLQVSAVRRPEAQTLAEILQKKGFPATLTPSPKEGIYRVVVGPFKDSAEAARTRTGLDGIGLKNAVIVRY
jgi:cell division protein FtsN